MYKTWIFCPFKTSNNVYQWKWSSHIIPQSAMRQPRNNSNINQFLSVIIMGTSSISQYVKALNHVSHLLKWNQFPLSQNKQIFGCLFLAHFSFSPQHFLWMLYTFLFLFNSFLLFLVYVLIPASYPFASAHRKLLPLNSSFLEFIRPKFSYIVYLLQMRLIKKV